MVCFICPKSCFLSVQEVNGEIRVEGNHCLRGIEFARKEHGDPERILTSTMRVNNGTLPLVSIRSENPVKKAELINLIKHFDVLSIDAPISNGQTLFSGIGQNKVNIIATRSVEQRK
jgi:CxxC motif-containing protein